MLSMTSSCDEQNNGRDEGLFSPRLICGALVTIQGGPGMALLGTLKAGPTYVTPFTSSLSEFPV